MVIERVTESFEGDYLVDLPEVQRCHLPEHLLHRVSAVLTCCVAGGVQFRVEVVDGAQPRRA